MKTNQFQLLTLSCSLLFGQLAYGGVSEYITTLAGANEPPTPVASPGGGGAEVIFDSVAQTLQVEVTFSNLLGTTTASHIHGPTIAPFSGNAGVATTVPSFTGFPLGVNAGTYNHTFDLTLTSSYNPSFLASHGGTAAGAEAALIAAMNAGESYLNIHTTSYPGGEISGYLDPVPETLATAPFLAASLLLMFFVARRREAREA
jgi:CHRD domain